MFAREQQQNQVPADQAVIFDAGTADFEEKVLKASMAGPVLVDFWAPWCGPCKQLAPALEAAVRAAGGKVKLAKINIDENQELAQALRIQSVPTVFAFFQGQAVNAFAGVRTQTELKMFIDQLLRLAQQAQPDALNIPDVLADAAQALSNGDLATAQRLYGAILQQDNNNVPAYVGLVRTYIKAGALDQARLMIDGAPEPIAADPGFEAARTALELAESAPDGAEIAALAARVGNNPDDFQARFDIALALFAQGQKEEAIGGLIEIIRRKRDWEDDKARKQLLKFFEALGPSDPATIAGRRQLSSVLFS